MSIDQHDQPNGEPHADHNDLVAYLDGELDAASTDRIENLLASNPAIRGELHRLERTWDLLDELPRATVDESFGSSTAEMVAIAAEEELESQKADVPRQRRAEWNWLLGGLAGAVLCGYLAMRWVLPDPNAQLLADLPILENLDAYRQAGSVEFLRMLSADRPIPVAAGDATAAAPKAPTVATETPLAQRERVEKMTPQGKDQLGRKAQRFFDLPLDEQRQLRDLHAAIQQHPQRDELYRVMFSYYDWLKTLTSGEPTDLHQLPPNERLAKIKQIEGKRLATEDRQAIETWARKLAQDRKLDRRFDGRSGPPRDGRGEGPPRDGGRPPGGPGEDPPIRYLLFGLTSNFGNKGIQLTKQEIDQLRQTLTPPRKDYLALLNLQEQRDQVQDWMRSVAWRPASRPNLTEDQIRTMLKEMSPEQREQVLRRSPQDMHRYLRDRFYGGGPGGFGPPGKGRDGMKIRIAPFPPEFGPGPPPSRRPPDDR
jgi:hypothetical protein